MSSFVFCGVGSVPISCLRDGSDLSGVQYHPLAPCSCLLTKGQGTPPCSTMPTSRTAEELRDLFPSQGGEKTGAVAEIIRVSTKSSDCCDTSLRRAPPSSPSDPCLFPLPEAVLPPCHHLAFPLSPMHICSWGSCQPRGPLGSCKACTHGSPSAKYILFYTDILRTQRGHREAGAVSERLLKGRRLRRRQ